MKEQLLFVYNANHNLFSIVSDFAHKILSPATYPCHLCALTYSNFSIKQNWKTFIKNLPIDTVFLHKKEFENMHKISTDLPAVFISGNGVWKELVSMREINSCKSLEALKLLITEKLRQYDQHHYSHIQ